MINIVFISYEIATFIIAIIQIYRHIVNINFIYINKCCISRWTPFIRSQIYLYFITISIIVRCIYILYIEIIIYYNIIIINIIAIKYHLHAMPHNIVYIYLCLPSKLVCVGYQHYFIEVSSCRQPICFVQILILSLWATGKYVFEHEQYRYRAGDDVCPYRKA